MYMRRIKKLSLLFVMAVAFSFLSFNYVSASVEDTTSTEEAGVTVGGFRYVAAENDTVKITGYSGDNTDLLIPDRIDGKPVSAIGESAFYVDDFTSVSLPGSVTIIEEGGFKYCDELVTVEFRESGLITIGARAFDGCDALKNIVIPETVTTIEEGAFINSRSLKTITIPAGVTTLGDGIFYNSGISNVVISEGLTIIGERMFMGCDELTSVKLPDTIKEIRESAFSHCSNLKTITIPKAVKNIGESAFYATRLKYIICYQDSYAYTYAKSNNIEIKLLGPHFKASEVSLYNGGKKTLKVVNSTGTVKWKSSNSKIVKVSQKGVITAVKKGKATIYVTGKDFKVTCKVTVKELFLNKKKTTITEGKKVALKLTGASSTPIWKTSSSTVATVSKKGVVTGKKAGTATITAYVKGKKYTCKVTVRANVAKLPDYSSLYQTYGVGVSITKVYYSGGSLIAEGTIINNSSNKVIQLDRFTLQIYAGGTLAAEQVFTNYKVNISPHSKGKVKFVIKTTNVKKKKLDLRSENVTAKGSGSYTYYYY